MNKYVFMTNLNVKRRIEQQFYSIIDLSLFILAFPDTYLKLKVVSVNIS